MQNSLIKFIEDLVALQEYAEFCSVEFKVILKPQMIKEHSDDLTKLKCRDPSFHLSDDELFVGDSTAALSVHLGKNEGTLLTLFIRKW